MLLGVAVAGCGATDAAPFASGPLDTKIASLAPVALGPTTKLDKAIASHFAGTANQRTYIQIAALCKTKRKVQIEATLRDNRLAGGTFEVDAGTPAVVELPIASRAQGAVRVTLFAANDPPSPNASSITRARASKSR